MIFRRRKPKRRRSWHVVTHGWPVGVGTVSESMPREVRYAALAEMGRDQDHPAVDGEDKS